MISADLQDYQSRATWFVCHSHKLAYWYHQVDIHRPTILFIHGFPSASWDWHHQWGALASDYNLLAMDMLGFGLSDKPKKHRYSLVEQADLLGGLLAELNIQRCHLLAHDYGDSVAQEMLFRMESRQAAYTITSTTFLNGGLFSESHRPLLTQKLLKSAFGPLLTRLLSRNSLHKSFCKIFGPHSPPSSEDVDVLWQLLSHHQGTRVMPALLSYIDERITRRELWLKAMQHTQVPLFFINGALDPISGEHMRKRYIELIPNALTHSLPVGHYPQLEAPHQVNQAFAQFLRGQL